MHILRKNQIKMFCSETSWNYLWCVHFQNYVWDTHFLLSKSSWKPGEQLQAPVDFLDVPYEVFVLLLNITKVSGGQNGPKISICICSLI